MVCEQLVVPAVIAAVTSSAITDLTTTAPSAPAAVEPVERSVFATTRAPCSASGFEGSSPAPAPDNCRDAVVEPQLASPCSPSTSPSLAAVAAAGADAVLSLPMLLLLSRGVAPVLAVGGAPPSLRNALLLLLVARSLPVVAAVGGSGAGSGAAVASVAVVSCCVGCCL